MWQHWRVLQIIIFLYVILTGLYALRYDHKLRQFRNSSRLQFYTIAHNILILLLIPIDLLESLTDNFNTTDMYPSLRYIDLMITLLRATSTSLTLLTRWQHERQLCDIIVELSRLDVKFNCDRRHTPLLTKLLYSKMINISCFIATAFTNILALLYHRKIFPGAASATVVNAMFFLNMTVLHYFIFLLQVYNILLLLNDQLLAVWQQVASMTQLKSTKSVKLQKQLAADLCELSSAHAQVSQLLSRLNATYNSKLLATLAMYFVTIVSFCYLLLLVITHYNPLDIIIWVWNLALLSLGFVDLLLFIILSDRFNGYSAEVSSILHQIQEISSSELLLIERSSELVSLQLLMCNFEVNVSGLFVINRRTVFGIASSVLLYIIFLMQADYKRKFNAHQK